MRCLTYLGLGEAAPLGGEVEDDSLRGSGQRDAPYQRHGQHQVGEGGREVHHLHTTPVLDVSFTNYSNYSVTG